MPELATLPEYERLVISFETPSPEADAAAVAETVRALVKLLNAATSEVKPSARLSIKARALVPGSVNVPIDIVIPSLGAGALFIGANLSTIADAVKLVKNYFELRLLGKKKDSGSKGEINFTVNNSGTLNLLLNSEINVAVGDAANAIEADPTIKSVSVLEGEDRKPLLKIKREQLGNLKYDDKAPIIKLPARRERQIKNASLVVRAPDLLGDSMWSFNYKSHKIDASIQDAKFMQAVRNGEKSFTAGTQLVGDMTVQEEFDTTTDDYVPKKYTITKVHHLEQQKQLPHSEQGGQNAKPAKRGKSNNKRGSKDKK